MKPSPLAVDRHATTRTSAVGTNEARGNAKRGARGCRHCLLALICRGRCLGHETGVVYERPVAGVGGRISAVDLVSNFDDRVDDGCTVEQDRVIVIGAVH